MTTLISLQVPFVDLASQYAVIKDEVREAIDDVLASGHFVGGEWVERFENEFREFVGAKHAVGVSSGTAALELALKATGVGPGDDVIVPANSFFATAEAVSNVGAQPVFADIDPVTFHLDIRSVRQVVTERTRAVIAVHLYGRAMDMADLEQFSVERDIPIIEDAAQAHGAELGGVKIGGSGRLCCFSFYPGKNLGAYGDGGAVTGGDERQISTIRLLRDHGSPVKYEHSIVGTNARLDSIQAAVLSVKLRYLPIWNSMRREHALAYASAFAGTHVSPPAIPPKGEHVFHLFVVRCREREALRQHLAKKGVSAAIHYPVPLHLTKAYQDLGAPRAGALPVCESVAQEILSLPMFAELLPEQLNRVIHATLAFPDALSEAA